MSNLVQLIKQASLEANEAAVPMGMVFGTVVSSAPLKVQIDQKITLDDEFLVVPENLTDYTVNMIVSHSTEITDLHRHAYSGTKSFKVLNGLRAGEKVILLRMQGGQKYIVLDRMVSG